MAPQEFKLGVQTLSDLVFGLALGIGSIILVAKLPQKPVDLAWDVVTFGFSFLIIVLAWVGYRRSITTLPYETNATLGVNVALLYCVSIEPFLFYVVLSGGTLLEFASSIYAIDIGAIMLLLSGLDYLLLAEEKKRTHGRLNQSLRKRLQRTDYGRVTVGCAFLVSALPPFWANSPLGYVRMDIWLACLGSILLTHRILRLAHKPREDKKTASRESGIRR